jgi:nicotinamidase-related amidase
MMVDMGTTALLVMDFQVGVVQRVAEGSEVLLETVNRATTAARDRAIAVIYVQVAFRAKAPEISGRNQIFSAIASSGTMNLNDSTTQIHPAIAPREDDIVVTKKRVSAFTGSDLDVVLRSLDVESLVLTGIATSGVVLSTLRQAADLDYEITVLRDACADSDAEVHRVLLDKVFPRQATVVGTDEWIGSLRGGPSGATH